MSTNQLHGKTFENLILKSLNIEESKNNTAIFDIPLISASKCAGSIKTTGLNTIYLSDATRVWNWHSIINSIVDNDEYTPTIRMVVGVYFQNNTIKEFHTIYDIKTELNRVNIKNLYGEITSEEIYGFHMGLKKEFFPDHNCARSWAEKTKKKLQQKGGLIKLNYKIDSKEQRRLQCSIELKDLLSISSFNVNSFLNLNLPIKIESSQRKRNKKIKE